MAASTELDVVTRLPKVDDIPLDELLKLDRPVLADFVRRLRANGDEPQDAVTPFANAPSVLPG